MAGELGGLLLAPEAIGGAGEAAAAATGIGEGAGLLGAAAKASARLAAESAVMGAQRQITEDALGDHQYNAEAVFSAASKDALLGGVIGAPFGALGYGARKGVGLLGEVLGKTRGPTSHAVLDQLAGAEGAGAGMRDAAARFEDSVEGLRSTGATAEQAVRTATDLETLGKASGDGVVGDWIKRNAVEPFAEAHGGARGDLIRKQVADTAAHHVEHELAADALARELADAGTTMRREMRGTSDAINFTERPEQFAKMLDPTKYSAARDALASMSQETRALIGQLDMLPTRTLVPSRIGKVLQEADLVMSHLPEEPSAKALAEAWSANYRVKQAVGKAAGFSKFEHLRTPEENAFAELYEKLRVGFEDTNAFGRAGEANAEWNKAFTDGFGRVKDFDGKFALSLEQGPGGIPLPELDAGKLKGFLNQVGGAEADQGIKSTRAMIDWERTRAAKIAEYGELSAEQQASMAKGRAALDTFEKKFEAAVTKSEAANKIRQAKFDEAGNGIGGVLGLFTDAVTKPLKTADRLGHVIQTVNKVEGAIRSGLRKALNRGGGESAGRVVESAAPRAKEKIIADIESIRGLAANPAALEAAAQRMVGPLSDYAPKTANQIRLTAMRTLLYLASEAPRASTTENGIFAKPTGRYSDIAIHDWESKRIAAYDNRTVVHDLENGVINRDAIKAAEFAQPKLFAKMQSLALEELQRAQASGVVDRMSYQDKAAYATLLKVAPDETWTPKFMAMIQASKQAPPPAPPPQQVNGAQVPRKSNSKPTADSFMTGAEKIEAGGSAR